MVAVGVEEEAPAGFVGVVVAQRAVLQMLEDLDWEVQRLQDLCLRCLRRLDLPQAGSASLWSSREMTFREVWR